MRTKFAFESFAASYGNVPFPLPSISVQHQERSHKQERNVVVPMKKLINDFKSLSAFSIPNAQMYGTFNIFNQASYPELALPDNQMASMRTIPSASALTSNQSQVQLQQGRSQAQKQNKKQAVENLASKIKTLFSVTYLSFLGHMQAATHSSMDPKEELPKPVLGQISPNLRAQFKKQIEDVLDFTHFPAARRVNHQTKESVLTKDHEENVDLKSNGNQSCDYTNQENGLKSDLAQQNSAAAIIADQKTHLFREDQRAQVSRIRLKGFVHGQKLCYAMMCKQDPSENFSLLRRYDRAGYNETRKPFKDIMRGQHGAGIKHVNSMKSLIKDEHSRSILSLQNEFKMPGPVKRKARGQAIEKILENSYKPWYLPSNQSEQSDDKKSAKIEKQPQQPSKNTSPDKVKEHIFRNTEGAYMSRKRPLVQEGPQTDLEYVSSNQSHSQDIMSQVSSKRSIFQLVQDDQQSESRSKSSKHPQIQPEAKTQEDVRDEDASFHDYSEFTNQNQITESINAQELIPQIINSKASEPQLGTVESPKGGLKIKIQSTGRQSKYTSKQQSVKSKEQPKATQGQKMPDPLLNRGRPAVIVAEAGAPCIVLNALSNQQRIQQKIVLKYNDVVYIDKDLFINGEDKAIVLLTKCYLFKQGGIKVDLVIAREFLRIISEEELEALNLQFTQDQQIVAANEHLLTQESYYSDKVERKITHETSADNFLRQSPTKLDLYMKPQNQKLDKNQQAIQGMLQKPEQNNLPQKPFSKLNKRRIEKKLAQLQSLKPSPDELYDFSPVKDTIGGHLVKPVPHPLPQHRGERTQPTQQTPSYPTQMTELHISKELSSSCDDLQIIREKKGVVKAANQSAVPVALKVNERLKKRQQKHI